MTRTTPTPACIQIATTTTTTTKKKGEEVEVKRKKRRCSRRRPSMTTTPSAVSASPVADAPRRAPPREPSGWLLSTMIPTPAPWAPVRAGYRGLGGGDLGELQGEAKPSRERLSDAFAGGGGGLVGGAASGGGSGGGNGNQPPPPLLLLLLRLPLGEWCGRRSLASGVGRVIGEYRGPDGRSRSERWRGRGGRRSREGGGG